MADRKTILCNYLLERFEVLMPSQVILDSSYELGASEQDIKEIVLAMAYFFDLKLEESKITEINSRKRLLILFIIK